jgi:hypothetical protein
MKTQTEPVKLTELECERLGRLYGDLMTARVAALQQRVEMLQNELARRDAVQQEAAGNAFNAELSRLAAAYGFDPSREWKLDPITQSLVPVPGDGA